MTVDRHSPSAVTAGRRWRALPQDVLFRREAGVSVALVLMVAIAPVAEAIVAFVSLLRAEPTLASVAVGAAWVGAWALVATHPFRTTRFLTRFPLVLMPLVGLAVAPALLDGGFPGDLATQPIALVVLFAAARRPWAGVVCAVALSFSRLAVFWLAGNDLTGVGDLGLPVGVVAFWPIAVVLGGLLLVWAVEGVLVSVEDARARALSKVAAQSALTAAEGEVRDMLVAGLHPKQIALERGTSLDTVRTQIRSIKRKVGARTLAEIAVAPTE